MANPNRLLDTVVAQLEECSPALSLIDRQLDNVLTGRDSAYWRCLDKSKEIRDALQTASDDIHQAVREVDAERRDLLQRGNDYKADFRDANQKLGQSMQSLQAEMQRSTGLESQLRGLYDDLDGANAILHERNATVDNLRTSAHQELSDANAAIHERDATIDGLQRQLRQARRESSSSAGLHPDSTSPRPSTSDSGISGISRASKIPDDQTRYTTAARLYDKGVNQLRQKQYLLANTTFTELEGLLPGLPAPLRNSFHATELAYYLTICRAEASASDSEAQVLLFNFLRLYDGSATNAQQAHITQLLALRLARQNRTTEAFSYTCSVIALWHEIDCDSDHYFDALALLVRLTYLQGRAPQASAMIDACPQARREYVRDRYRSLSPVVRSGASVVDETELPAPQTKAAEKLSGAPKRSSGSVASGGTKVSSTHQRRQDAKKLPFIFRVALT
ncbi:hypothetical protein LTR62_008303 [Meristemomyces frigidus]|uniref:Uncharacterized protein n=1 Tax=Meristemomyces frigidus TaxID=1508187 RepID=A0AAN7YNB3_9PEZI|nr:hypothetical protein LTR62_008303 [Meristemomyces frigidus]